MPSGLDHFTVRFLDIRGGVGVFEASFQSS